jgi:hypothetical protein
MTGTLEMLAFRWLTGALWTWWTPKGCAEISSCSTTALEHPKETLWYAMQDLRFCYVCLFLLREVQIKNLTKCNRVLSVTAYRLAVRREPRCAD